MICQNAEEANRVLGQMKFTVRATTPAADPTAPGDRSGDEHRRTARAIWKAKSPKCARIKAMRQKLFEVLTAKVLGRDFSFFVKQRGMFSYNA